MGIAPVYPISPRLPPELPPDLTGEDASPRRSLFWIALVLAALLFHALLFLAHVDWGRPLAPPRVDVEQVDPAKLDAIRKRWRQQEKGLLLDKNQAAADHPPENAKYISNKNIRVEKEQRAKDHVLLPKPGAPNASTQAKSQARAQAKSSPQGLPSLGNLGVPFRLGEKPGPRQNKSASAAGPSGGEQYVDDKNLPTGSETLLNAEESVYYSFYSRLYEAIGPIWSSRLREVAAGTRVQPGDYTTAVDVVLDREGNLVEVRLEQSSGVKEFDEVVSTSWKKIGKFPNPPSGLIKEDGHVHTGWSFTVQLGGGAGFMLMPPERNY